MKCKSVAMHHIDINDYASTEHWYYTYHGPQLARRYGPWLDRFESYRPAPAPVEAGEYGLVNYLCTVGIWNGVPERGPKGEMALIHPLRSMPARFTSSGRFSVRKILRVRISSPVRRLFCVGCSCSRYPSTVDKKDAEDWYVNDFAKQACEKNTMFRFFSYKSLDTEIHLPGEWKKDTYKDMKGGPEDHHWDRLTEMWFEGYNDWRIFINESFRRPDWATFSKYPFCQTG